MTYRDGLSRTAPTIVPDDDRELRVEITSRIGSAREASWILEHTEGVLGLDGRRGAEAARALAARRAAGEPLQYVLGRWSFRTLELDVDRRVLIPRPETEVVVGVALRQLARSVPPAGVGGDPVRVCDLGTGSGAIALSLAAEAARPPPGLEVWATDRSTDALCVARANRDRLAREGRLGSSRVELAEGDWYGALDPALAGRIDLVVANPPYVAEEELAGLDSAVRDHEPRGSLVAATGRLGTPGAADVESVVLSAPRWLRPTGSLVVEIAPHQGDAALDAARSAGFTSARLEPDLVGRLRVLVAAW